MTRETASATTLPRSRATPTGAGGGRRGDVLAALRGSREALSIVDIATQLRLHPNTVRFHLEALVEAGQAERVEHPRTGPGRPPQMFRAHRGMDPAGPRNYRLLAEILTAQLAADPDPSARAAEAGRRWGREMARDMDTAAPTAEQAVNELVRVLDEVGFDPEPDTDDDQPKIRLQHCPFLDLTETRASVVCPIHLGLMQGVLEGRAAPVTVQRLDPFVTPDLCLAHLTTTSTATPAQAPTGSAA
ncbi:helix-turn-helix domain-containing protein [Nocardia cyriacigeorgica]|uniref:helix-turn-helix transcriptional regulator n=1 Tax=Nocardia cyriacigeorgica TaxID=135487 RepID=UPI00189359C7|nr:helix-turn-helix domain-containing protein [Nocardia cyriacigeorgica]MBF6080249.1 helix-turn-helix domain-containing protein [Nocardia cyriacigeorgica]